MMPLDAIGATEIEPLRLNVQAQIDRAKTQEERNRLGQFATPTALAIEILTCAYGLMPQTEGVRFLDPAFGTGSFYSALNRIFPAERIVKAAGFEIDPQYGLEAQRLWQAMSLTLHLTDFTHAEPPTSESDRYNLLICNPPYVRHHHIDAAEKNRLLTLVRRLTGIQLSGLTGLYGYFMLLCHPWMTEGGLACWLIPAEFMDVKYGGQIKRYLLEQVTLLRVHCFPPQEVQFGDALVSSVVVWFRKQQPTSAHQVEFTYGNSLLTPATTRRLSIEILKRIPKWTSAPTMNQEALEKLSATIPLEATLGDLFLIKRGIATGANDFFVLSREQAVAHHLPWQFLTPILPSPRYLDTDEVLSDDDGNPRLKPQLFLVDCAWPEERVRAEQPALWHYLELGKARGIHQRYLSIHRTPWYAQEKRPPSPLLCTYMGRWTPRKPQPFRFILNHSRAIAPNVYLMLYPRPALAAELQCKPDLLRAIWVALNQLPSLALISEGRVYGGGLHKIEPAELSQVSADGIMRLVPTLAPYKGRQLALFEP